MVRFTQNTEDYYFSVDRLTLNLEGRVAKAYHEETAKWITAEILSCNVDQQEAEILYIQPKEKKTVSSIFVKLLPVPDK